MEKRIFTEDLFKNKESDDVVELLYEKKRRTILNVGLLLVYVGLLVVSLFVV